MGSDPTNFLLPLPTLDGVVLLDTAASVALLGLLVAIRLVAIRLLRSKTGASPHIQRRWSATIRNVLFLLGVIGLVLIWAPQLRTFALSLTAVAVAFVVATKELIPCFSGSFLGPHCQSTKRAASAQYRPAKPRAVPTLDGA